MCQFFKSAKYLNFHCYDHYIVRFTDGKNSTAYFLYLLQQGVPKNKFELWYEQALKPVDVHPIEKLIFIREHKESDSI